MTQKQIMERRRKWRAMSEEEHARFIGDWYDEHPPWDDNGPEHGGISETSWADHLWMLDERTYIAEPYALRPEAFADLVRLTADWNIHLDPQISEWNPGRTIAVIFRRKGT